VAGHPRDEFRHRAVTAHRDDEARVGSQSSISCATLESAAAAAGLTRTRQSASRTKPAVVIVVNAAPKVSVT